MGAVAAEAEDADVLELTEIAEDPPAPIAEPEPEPEPVAFEPEPPAAAEPVLPEPDPEPLEPDDRLVSSATEDLTSAAFARLSDRDGSDNPLPLGNGAATVEQIVREMLRPMLSDWLDANLPEMVERAVEREVSRIGRSGHNR